MQDWSTCIERLEISLVANPRPQDIQLYIFNYDGDAFNDEVYWHGDGALCSTVYTFLPPMYVDMR